MNFNKISFTFKYENPKSFRNSRSNGVSALFEQLVNVFLNHQIHLISI